MSWAQLLGLAIAPVWVHVVLGAVVIFVLLAGFTWVWERVVGPGDDYRDLDQE